MLRFIRYRYNDCLTGAGGCPAHTVCLFTIRIWAAKGVRLAGVEAIVAEGFERIHRTNLVGMGVLPLEFNAGESRQTYAIDGSETFDVIGQPTPRASRSISKRIVPAIAYATTKGGDAIKASFA